MTTCSKCPAALDKRNKTGLCAEHSIAWSEADDAALCDAMADGASYHQAAARIGRTKDAVVGRWRKICRSMGAQAA